MRKEEETNDDKLLESKNENTEYHEQNDQKKANEKNEYNEPGKGDEPNEETASYENSFKTLYNNAILIARKTERKENELITNYDHGNIQYLNIKSDEEKSNILKLINNILLSCNFSFTMYAVNKIFGYLKSLFFYNIFYFFGIKLIYKFLDNKKEEKILPKASRWKRLLLFNIPELILIFYYHKRKLTKINTAIYSCFTFLNEKISFEYNRNEQNNYLCQVNQKDFNIYLIPKEENNQSEKIMYLNNPEKLEKDSFYDRVIAYPNVNFEDFDFNNLTEDEEKMYQDIFTLINEVEKKLKEEYSLYNTIGTICSNLSYNNSTNYNIRNALVFKIVSFFILEIYLNSIKKRKRRKVLFEEKQSEFNEKNMKNGYFLALNEHVILLYKIKDEYKNFDEAYNELYNKCKKFMRHYFESVNRIL